MKLKIEIICLISILFLIVVVVSGCTSNSTSSSDSKTYNGFVSFQYPSSWSITKESESWIQFKTPNGETRIWLYNTTKSYENFQEKTIGNITYHTIKDGNMISYAISRNGKEFFMIGMNGEESGHEMILKTVQF